MPKCKRCGFKDKAEKFDLCFSPYHDFKCPECGTTNIDTSDYNSNEYGYGNNNTLDTSDKQEGNKNGT